MTCWRWVIDLRGTWIWCSLPPQRPWILSCCFLLRCMAAQTSQLLSWPSFAPPPPPPCNCPALATCWPCASSLMLTSVVAVSTPAGPKSREVDGQQTDILTKVVFMSLSVILAKFSGSFHSQDVVAQSWLIQGRFIPLHIRTAIHTMWTVPGSSVWIPATASSSTSLTLILNCTQPATLTTWPWVSHISHISFTSKISVHAEVKCPKLLMFLSVDPWWSNLIVTSPCPRVWQQSSSVSHLRTEHCVCSLQIRLQSKPQRIQSPVLRGWVKLTFFVLLANRAQSLLIIATICS